MASSTWIVLITVSVIVLANLAEGNAYFEVADPNYCQGVKHRFSGFSKDRISDCVKECALRPYCEALNFHARTHLCELFSALDTEFRRNRCSHVRRKDISTKKLVPCARTCNKGAMCDPKTKSCVFKDCINLPDVENGKVLGYSKSVGSRLSAKCSMYYKPKNGKRQAFCTAKGTWKPSLECIPMKKCKIPQIENGEVSGDSEEVGSKISLTCNEHYQVEDDIDESYCTPRGEWEPPMECQRIPGCIDLPQIKNGEVVGESTELGSKISVTCNQYLEAKDGINESICTENGWNPMMECVPKHGICDELDAPENLTLKDGNGTAVGSIRTFSCPPDFVDIETSLTWTCQPAGNWDGVASKCVPKKCSNVRCYAFYDGSFLVVQSEENIPADTPEICISKCEELMGDNLKSVLFKTIKVEKNNCKCNDETLTPDEVLMPWFSAYSYFTY